MFRTSSLIILAAAVVFGILGFGLVALQIFRGAFKLINSTVPTPIVIVVEAAAENINQVIVSTPTAEINAGPSVIISTATIDVAPTAAAAPIATIMIEAVNLESILALTDVNIRSGPSTNYGVVGSLAEGQIVRVTGSSSDGGWWRIVCPGYSRESCWVTSQAQYSQPTSEQAMTGTASDIANCSDKAILVSDVTIPDNTAIAPSTTFRKVWRIRNSGTCTWDDRYRLIHTGGHLMGAGSSSVQLSTDVFPGQSIDLKIDMVSPAEPAFYQSDWKLQNQQGQSFGIGHSSSPFWVKIEVPGSLTTISGVVYQDANLNGVYDSGEVLLDGRQVWLIDGTACNVRKDPVVTAISDGVGYYVISGSLYGSYCVGLSGESGLDDVVPVKLTAGETSDNINLRSPFPSGSISGYFWNDYCLTNENGEALDGNCMADERGDFRADGIIQSSEVYISGVTILLYSGSCVNSSVSITAAVTDLSGRYFFGNLSPGTYCVFIDPAAPENSSRLLSGEWTYPARGIGYQQILLVGYDNAFPVNFGWDYKLD